MTCCRSLTAGAALVAVLLAAAPALSDPDSLHVGPTAPDGLIAIWSGGPYTASNPSGGLQEEPDCNLVPGSCDDMILTLELPPGYAAAHPADLVTVSVDWTPQAPGQDVDIYFQDPVTGASVHPAAATSSRPEVAYWPLTDGITTIRVRVVMFSAANLTFTGTVRVGDPIVDVWPGVGTYVASTDVWSCNRHLQGPEDVVEGNLFDHSFDFEPQIRFDPTGRGYVCAIAGVGAGTGLWTTQDDCAQSTQFLGPVDRGVGGGQADVETATAPNLLGHYNAYVSSLTLANISMAMSCDGGDTFTVTPVSTPFPIDDRPWNAAHGASTCYLSYRQGATSPGNFLECVRLTYADCVTQPLTSPPSLVWDNTGANPPTWARQLGNLATDRRDHPDNALLQAGPDGEGALYHGYTQEDGSTGASQVWVAGSQDFATTSPWSNTLVWSGQPGVRLDYLYTWVSVDLDGNVWTTFSDGASVHYAVSTDRGTTWSDAVRVNGGGASRTAIIPQVAAGAGGTAVFSYYGHSGSGITDPTADWDVFVTTTRNGLDAFTWADTPPVLEEAIVNDRSFHSGPVCMHVLTCSCCTEILYCFDVGIDPSDGRAMVAYASRNSGVWITNQLAGTSNLTGAPLPDLSALCPNPETFCIPPDRCGFVPSCECPACGIVVDLDSGDSPPVPVPALNIREVGVAEPGLLSPDPVGGDVLIFSMKVEQLDPKNLPVNAVWQVIFDSPAGQFFVRLVNCAVEGLIGDYGHFDLGTEVDGALPHWELSADGNLCMWISRSEVGDPQPGDLLVVTGHTRQLVGNCPSPSALPEVDATNSAAYLVAGNDSHPCNGDPPVDVPSRERPPDGLDFRIAGPNPFRGATTLDYTLPAASRVRIDVYDVAGRFVASLVDRDHAAGRHTVSLRAETDAALEPGVYLVRIRAAGRQETLRAIALE